MSKQVKSNTPDELTAPQLSKVRKACEQVYELSTASDVKVGDIFRKEFVPLYIVANVVVLNVRQQLTAELRAVYTSKALSKAKAAKLDDAATLAAVDKAKKVANATFSRAAAEFEPAKKSKRAAQTTKKDDKSDAADKAGTTPLSPEINAAPSVLARLQDMAKATMQARDELIAFQGWVANAGHDIPAPFRAEIGEKIGATSQVIAKVFAEFGEVLEAMLPKSK